MRELQGAKELFPMSYHTVLNAQAVTSHCERYLHANENEMDILHYALKLSF